MFFCHRSEGVGKIVRYVGWRELKLHSQAARRALDFSQHADHCTFAVGAGVPEGSHTRKTGNDLSEKLETPGNQLGTQKRRPSNVPAWPCQAGD